MGYLFSWAPLSKAVTESWLDASEIAILICGLVLAFGAAGEYIEEHGTLPRWMKWSRQPKMVFVWMVGLSLVGEFVGDAGVFAFSRHLQTINDGEAAALNKEAGQARLDAGKANERAEALEKETATLRKHNLELAEQLLTLGNRAFLLRADGPYRRSFIEALKPLKGRAADVRYCNVFSQDPEVMGLAKAIAAAFHDAGLDFPWNRYNEPPTPQSTPQILAFPNCSGAAPGADQGIWILAPTGQSDLLKPLLKAFADAHINAVPSRTPPNSTNPGEPDADVKIVVLANPSGQSKSSGALLQSVMSGAVAQ